jgi:hypothetical protein
LESVRSLHGALTDGVVPRRPLEVARGLGLDQGGVAEQGLGTLRCGIGGLALLLCLVFVAPAGALTSGYFKTPSGNIVCFYLLGSGASVVCGIKSGLRPKPPYTARCKAAGLDYNADRIFLGATGRAQPRPCSGDAGPFVGEHGAGVLAYGKTWSGGGLRWTSTRAGLTCRNRSGHGFFLSRAHWRSF